MTYNNLVFDLDGTISDPKDGIVNSLNYALSHYGFEKRKEEELSTFIGPPLDQIFQHLTGENNHEIIQALISKYRERYADVGYAENTLYQGMEDVIIQLKMTPGIRLGVCTTKRVDFAERILKMFDLDTHFDFIDGGDIGIQKEDQLKKLLKDGYINQNTVMIGDRYIDVNAARKNGLDSVGVLWGYGSRSELDQCQPTYIFKHPSDLITLVKAASQGSI